MNTEQIYDEVNEMVDRNATELRDCDFDFDYDKIEIESFTYSYGSLDVDEIGGEVGIDGCGDGDAVIDKQDFAKVIEAYVVKKLSESSGLDDVTTIQTSVRREIQEQLRGCMILHFDAIDKAITEPDFV